MLRPRAGEGSTTLAAQANPGAGEGAWMDRRFLFVLLLGLLVLGLVVLSLGAFPPEPQPQPVHKVLPADRFGKTPG